MSVFKPKFKTGDTVCGIFSSETKAKIIYAPTLIFDEFMYKFRQCDDPHNIIWTQGVTAFEEEWVKNINYNKYWAKLNET